MTEKGEAVDWLTREQIDQVIGSLSAADLIGAMGDGININAPKMAGDAFDSAASRLGFSNGTPATEHVQLSDFQYMVQAIKGAVNLDSPLSSEEESSQGFVATGE